MEYAHIWVAPPQSGDEYIFHCRPLHPKHGHKPMSMQKLRTWYEDMLQKAEEEGIVSHRQNIEEATKHLTSIREFPLFYGDFFPEEMQRMLAQEDMHEERPHRAAAPRAELEPSVPKLVRHTSLALAQKMQKRAHQVRQRFLVAKLNSGVGGGAPLRLELERKRNDL
eukprot:2041199-Prymnesium_polylepis.1